MSHQSNVYRARHVVVLAHPDAGSFNSLLADAYCDAVKSFGQDAIVRDLYAMGFDPVLKASERPGKVSFSVSEDVVSELDVIRGSDVFVTVFPIWFGMPPAMMVGYIDRVLGSGVTARQVKERNADTVMRGKRLLSITTSGNSKSWLNHQDQMQSLRTILGGYLLNAFGLKEYQELHFGETVEGLEQEFVDPLLWEVAARAKAICATVAAERAGDRPAVS